MDRWNFDLLAWVSVRKVHTSQLICERLYSSLSSAYKKKSYRTSKIPKLQSSVYESLYTVLNCQIQSMNKQYESICYYNIQFEAILVLKSVFDFVSNT